MGAQTFTSIHQARALFPQTVCPNRLVGPFCIPPGPRVRLLKAPESVACLYFSSSLWQPPALLPRLTPLSSLSSLVQSCLPEMREIASDSISRLCPGVSHSHLIPSSALWVGTSEKEQCSLPPQTSLAMLSFHPLAQAQGTFISCLVVRKLALSDHIIF